MQKLALECIQEEELLRLQQVYSRKSIPPHRTSRAQLVQSSGNMTSSFGKSGRLLFEIDTCNGPDRGVSDCMHAC